MRNRLIALMCFAFAASLVVGSVSTAADPTLVGWWMLDETSGMTAADSSGNGNDGTLSGYLGGDEWTTGIDGGALRFNWDGYVNCGTASSLDITTDFTVCAWLKPAPGSESSYMGVGGRLVSSPTYQGFALVRHSSGVYRLWTANQATAAVVGASSSATYTASEWHHVAGVRTGSTCSLYVDGVKAGSADVPTMAPSSNFAHIGMQYANSPTDRLWIGLIDDFRLYSRGLTDAEIAGLGTVTKALNPSPVDGAVEVVAPLFQWKAASNAMLQDVYFGTNPTPDAAEYKGRQPAAMSIYFHPLPLDPGVTYYWRVDEVAADGTVSQGDVWTFVVMPLKAHFPSPADGALWRKTDLKASWTAGQGALSHVLYAGTDRDPVAAGEPGALLATLTETSFDAAGLLEPGTTYYWRIDEVDASGAVHAGDVWTFSTIDPEGGALAQYWDNMTFAGEPKVVKIVPEINFDWGDGPAMGVNSPDPNIPTNLFSCRWTAELQVPVTGKYILYEASDDGARMWLNGQKVAEGWWDRGTTEDRTLKLDLVAGEQYLLVMEMYENGGGATAFLRWSGPGIPKEIIPQGALMPPRRAFLPSPSDGATGLFFAPELKWSGGVKATGHDVYLGDSEATVASATTGSKLYKGRVATAAFKPGDLTLGKTYYWRVDEVNEAEADSPWKGAVWSFKVSDYSLIDDFEAYEFLPVAPAKKPLGWWKFNGDATDSSGNGFNGTANGEPVYIDGVNGQAIQMDGVDDFVVVGSVGISGTMPRTIAGWAKADTTNIVDWTNVFGFTSTPDGGCDLSFDIDKIGGANQYCIHCYCFEVGYVEIDLEWHHLAATYDGTTIKWYSGGKLAGSQARVLATQDNVQMGKRGHAAGGNWPGSVDDVRIYNYALSGLEIKSLAGYVPPLVLSDAWKGDGVVTPSLAANVVHGGGQALKLGYNTRVVPCAGAASKTPPYANLTRGGANAISVWVRGDPKNYADWLFVAVMDTGGALFMANYKDMTGLSKGEWSNWVVPLQLFSANGVKTTSVAKIGVGAMAGRPGPGTFYVDDIRLIKK